MNDRTAVPDKPIAVRFRDPGSPVATGPALVICPRCCNAAQAVCSSVVCFSCGFSSTMIAEQSKSANLVHVAWQPRCQKCGAALPKTARRRVRDTRRDIPVRCGTCNHMGAYAVRPDSVALRPDYDPVSGLPYFLSCAVGKNQLWARNLDHLDMLEAYIAAPIRERPLSTDGMTMLEKLPEWMKSAKNRKELRRAIRSLRSSYREAMPLGK